MGLAASASMSPLAWRGASAFRHVVAVAGMLCLACARREPPAPAGSASIALPDLHPLPVPAASPSPAAAPAEANDAAPGFLPQTRQLPRLDAAFAGRVASLWQGIIEDNAQLALPFFFPDAAYQQVKDVPNPSADWKHRLLTAYARDIHALHEHLGKDAPLTHLIELTVPQERARWVEPGEEYNKIGYYRVFGSRLRYRDAAGAEQSFEAKSLISWRGEWYVVHLSAMK